MLKNMFSFTKMVKFGSFEPYKYNFSKIENQKKNLSTPFTPHPYQISIIFFVNVSDKIFPSNIQKEFCNYLKWFVFHLKKGAQAPNNFCPFLGVSCPFPQEVPALNQTWNSIKIFREHRFGPQNPSAKSYMVETIPYRKNI